MNTKNLSFFILAFSVTILFTSCGAWLSAMEAPGNKMNQLELGMSKVRVTGILGYYYTISEKRIDEGITTEVLSYRFPYHPDEIYLFHFENDKLIRWHRELVPQIVAPVIQQKSVKAS